MDSVSTSDARELVAKSEVVVIDVRSKEEWAEFRIPGSINVPDPASAETLPDVPEDKRILLIDADGSGLEEAADALSEHGDIVAIKGGMSAWEGDDLPLQPSTDTELPLDDHPDEPLEERMPTA